MVGISKFVCKSKVKQVKQEDVPVSLAYEFFICFIYLEQLSVFLPAAKPTGHRTVRVVVVVGGLL